MEDKESKTIKLRQYKKKLNMHFHSKLLEVFEKKDIRSVAFLVDKISEKTKLDIDESTIRKFMEAPESHYLHFIVIFAICKTLNINPKIFFDDTEYDEFFSNYNNFFESGQLTSDINIISFLEEQYNVLFFSTNSEEKNEIVTGKLYFQEKKSKLIAILEIDVNQNQIKKYIGNVYFSLFNNSIYINFVNNDIGEISSIAFKRVITNSNKMNYVIAECLTTCSGTQKVPTVHRMIISKDDILEKNRKIIEMELQFNTSDVYLDLKKWNNLKSLLKVNDEILENDLLEIEKESIIIIKEKHLINIIKRYKNINNLNINMDELMVNLKLNDNKITYNKVGEKTNKDFYNYLKKYRGG